MDWFIPLADDRISQRAFLHLGMASASRYYRELVVPGIGGVWFLRQLSWSVAALRLCEEMAQNTPTRVAHGIEALANKLAWFQEGESASITGSRAFGHDEEGAQWSFKKLSNPQFYVHNTLRQGTVRALPALGFTGPGRFNSLTLTEHGAKLADLLLGQPRGGKGGRSVKAALVEWITSNEEPGARPSPSLVQGLWRDHVTPEEKALVRDRLRSDSRDSTRAPGDRRARWMSLFDSLGKVKELPIRKLVGRLEAGQKSQVETAQAYDALLAASQALVHACAAQVEIGRLLVSDLSLLLAPQIERLRKSADEFLTKSGQSGFLSQDAVTYARRVKETGGSTQILGLVAERDGVIVRRAEDQILRGPLFDRRRLSGDENEEEDGASESLREPRSTDRRIEQLYELWRDTVS
jgi:hypothetical protein